jgi:hypothetical protein
MSPAEHAAWRLEVGDEQGIVHLGEELGFVVLVRGFALLGERD